MRYRAMMAILLLAGSCILGAPARAADPLLIFAAASLKEALDDADAAYQKANPGETVNASYAASGTLARQIENGAPADLFISADLKWMDYLAGKQLIDAGSRGDLLANTLVLVAPVATAKPVKIDGSLDLAGLLAGGKLAMGDPQSVPAGDYGRTALQNLGLWDKVKDKVAGAESVRAALALVSRQEAPYGIVYATDAVADAGVKVVGTFPESSHPPIIYPAAKLASSKNPAAARLLAWLRSPAAAAFFTKQGFTDLAAKAR